MFSAASAAAPLLNGSAPATPDADTEVQFLEKLFALRDQVYAGTHPHIKLPPDVLARVAPRSQQTAPPSRPSANGALGGSSSQPLPPRRESSQQLQLPASGYGSPSSNGHRPATAKSTPSTIDPVLLTKSEHLIKAELQLKRHQIERTLEDQLNKAAHEKPLIDEHDLYVDCAGVLRRAQSIVKPVSGLQQIPTQSAERTESFDEHSYYSSNADSWSPDRANPTQIANGTETLNALTSQLQRSVIDRPLTVAHPDSAVENIARPIQPAIIDLDEDEAYEPADDIEVYEPELATAQEDEDEEDDYSPPPAAIGNHGMPQNGFRGRGRGRAGRQVMTRPRSPANNMKKRKRDDKKREREQRWQQHNSQPQQQQRNTQRVVRSPEPEPYIKEEPQSPPSFAATPDIPPNKRRAVQPSFSDPEGSNRQSQSFRMHDQEQVVRRRHPLEEPSSPTVIRHPLRRLEHDDQNLRRVASLHHARRPISPARVEDTQPESQRGRAASYALVDRPPEPVYMEESMRPVPRYIQESSAQYEPRVQSPAPMMPPPRRVVYDEFGTKYYATPLVDVRASVAPPSRRFEVDPYYEQASPRDSMMRPPVRQDPYIEGEFQSMAPPPQRRYVEVPDFEPMDARPIRQRELSHRPMESEYAPREVIQQRPVVTYEGLGAPRDQVQTRAYSVRPDVVRREAPAEYAPIRQESMQPSYVRVAATPRYRELSVAHSNVQGIDERRYYAAAPPQGRRYVEEATGERQMEAPERYVSETPRRVVTYRY